MDGRVDEKDADAAVPDLSLALLPLLLLPRGVCRDKVLHVVLGGSQSSPSSVSFSFFFFFSALLAQVFSHCRVVQSIKLFVLVPDLSLSSIKLSLHVLPSVRARLAVLCFLRPRPPSSRGDLRGWLEHDGVVVPLPANLEAPGRAQMPRPSMPPLEFPEMGHRKCPGPGICSALSPAASASVTENFAVVGEDSRRMPRTAPSSHGRSPRRAV